MMKSILLAGAALIAAPVFAQDKPMSPDTTTTAPMTEEQSAPTSTTPAPAQDSSTAMQTTTPDASVAAQPDPAESQVATAQPGTADPAAPASGAPVNKAEQVAQVVDTEFPTYDKDASGTLSKVEFASWMVALKSASDPATKAESAETKTWVGQAFTSADTDKNAAISKAELTGFLSQAG